MGKRFFFGAIGLFSLTIFAEMISFDVGFATRQGKREYMEDRFIGYREALTNHLYFGIFDGHSGISTANYLIKNLHENIFNSEKEMSKAILEGFLKTDEDLLKEAKKNSDKSGSTAQIFIANEKTGEAYFAWVGDSRALLIRDGKLVYATEDHSPTNKVEQTRIEAAGSFVRNGRVAGRLAMSRAFGDKRYKISFNHLENEVDKYLVTAIPSIEKFTLQPGKQYIVLLTDGVLEAMTNTVVAEMIIDMLEDSSFEIHQKKILDEEYSVSGTNEKLKAITENMRDLAFNLGSTDNITVGIVEIVMGEKSIN